MDQVPLFPLNTVLFPGARLPLKVFEQRYLELIKECLKQDREFVVVLISKGQEVGAVPEIFAIGTTAKIVDWGQQEDGILSIQVEGQERVYIREAEGAIGEVMEGKAEPFFDRVAAEQEHDAEFVSLLKKLQEHPLVRAQAMTIDYDDLTSVMWGLSSLLPVDAKKKQYLLELDNAQKRFDALHDLLQMLEG